LQEHHCLCLHVPALQRTCQHCNKDMRTKRAEQQEAAKAAADKGKWKDTRRAAKVMKEKMEDVYIASDGKAHICVMVFREDADRNYLTLEGTQLTILALWAGQSLGPLWAPAAQHTAKCTRLSFPNCG